MIAAASEGQINNSTMPVRLGTARPARTSTAHLSCCGDSASAAALLAAHRAFIAAASWARRSGERLSFLFTGGFAVTRPFFSWVCAEPLILRRARPARAADFLLALPPAAVVAAPSFCFSLANFVAPFCRRASSRRIFFWRVLSLIMKSTVLRLNHLVDLSLSS